MPSGLGPGGLVLRVALEFFCRARRSGWFLLGGGDLLNHFFLVWKRWCFSIISDEMGSLFLCDHRPHYRVPTDGPR